MAEDLRGQHGAQARQGGQRCAGGCGAAPVPAFSGRTNRHRLNRGGDRAADNALHTIVLVRMKYDQRTWEYVAHRPRHEQEGDRPVPETVRRPRDLPTPTPCDPHHHTAPTDRLTIYRSFPGDTTRATPPWHGPHMPNTARRSGRPPTGTRLPYAAGQMGTVGPSPGVVGPDGAPHGRSRLRARAGAPEPMGTHQPEERPE
uniref:transposase n=1 Tax=Streptomyces poriticola TaxID=3120506 RepID=UPI0038CD8987